jgi:acetolactate synthase-1/2/3 large subunit
MRMTGGQALAAQLAAEGIDRIYAVPGVQLDWAIDAIRTLDGRIALTVPRHEQATSYMADGHARSGAGIGVCMTVPGPGMTNALAGLATAYACSSPVLMICGQIHSQAIGRGWGMLHEIPDQSGQLASLSKWHAIVRSPEAIPARVVDAIRALRTGRPRPVVLEVPHDLLAAVAEIDPIRRVAPPAAPQVPDAVALERAVELLEGARFPVIYAGGGVVAADAQAELAELAQRLQAPVVMGEMGRGALSDRHPMAANLLAARPLMRRADVLLVVGSRFMQRMAPAAAWPLDALRTVFVNADAADVSPPRRADVFVHGDARLALRALADGVSARGTGPRAAQVAAARAWADAIWARLQPQLSYVHALRRAIPEDGVLVGELTQVGYLAAVAYPVWAPRTLLAPGYQGTLGYGYPTALGVAAANPGRTVVSITGDGGFGWSLQELATARRYGLGVIVVVFVDGHFGNVRLLQQMTFGATVATELANPDFVALAGAFGISAETAEGPQALEAAIGRARARGGPALIAVPVGPMPNPWPWLRMTAPIGAAGVEPPDPLRDG